MDEQKRNRLKAAFTVNAIILIVILAAVIIYQMVTLVTLSNRKSEIEAEIQYYIEQTEETEETIEWLESDTYLRYLAQVYGYSFPD